jgi:transketolase
VESVYDVAQAIDGPVYVRMLRREAPRLFDAAQPLRLNRARVLRTGSDVTIFSSGICTEEAMRATQGLADRGVSLTHVHVSTLKPFTDPQILEAIAGARYGAITMENHSIIGGLGSAVAECMAEAGLPKRLLRIGLKDQYAHGASRQYLMREYGLDALALVQAVETLVGRPLGLTEEDLAAVRLETLRTIEKTEDL